MDQTNELTIVPGAFETPHSGKRMPIAGILFVMPALIIYTIFLIIPVIGTIALSFVDWSGFNWSAVRFNGIDNYKDLAHDSVFWDALKHNAYFLLGAVIFKTGIALVMAIALEQGLRFSGLFRGIFLMPIVVPFVVVGIVFNLFLSPTLGAIANPLVNAIGLGSLQGNWLGDPQAALPLVIGIDAWHGFGIFMFLFIIRIMSIPSEVHEAARVDGASRMRDIWHVTLPYLRPTIAVVVLLAAVESLKTFDLIYVMTAGGPGHNTQVVSFWAYFQNFQASRVGYASALLVVLLFISLVLSAVIVARSRSHEDFA